MTLNSLYLSIFPRFVLYFTVNEIFAFQACSLINEFSIFQRADFRRESIYNLNEREKKERKNEGEEKMKKTEKHRLGWEKKPRFLMAIEFSFLQLKEHLFEKSSLYFSKRRVKRYSRFTRISKLHQLIRFKRDCFASKRNSESQSPRIKSSLNTTAFRSLLGRVY